MAEQVINLMAYGEVVCKSFYDTDLGYGGIEVKIKADGEHLGQMVSFELPDENDEDEMENFENKVENWLIDNGH